MRTRGASSDRLTVEGDLGAVLEFMRLLWAVNHGLESMSKRMKSRVGVTGRERIVVRLIASRPGTSAGDLAQILHVDPSTLTGLLRRLVKRGLVLRTAHPDDARRAVLTLTPRGRSVDAMRSGTIEARVRDALGRAPARDARAAARVLSEIARALEGPTVDDASARRASPGDLERRRRRPARKPRHGRGPRADRAREMGT
jgi:DNA-binding MarR family transcriptional regulator